MHERPWHRFYEDGVPPSLEYQQISVPAMLDRAAERFPDRPALVFMNGRLSYAAFKDQVDRLAVALAALGVQEGSRVAVHAPNLPQTVIAYFATLRLGAITVMTNPLYTAREIEHQWCDAGVTVAILMDFLYEDRIKPVRHLLPVEHYVVASIPEYLRFPLNLLAPFKLKRMDPPMVATVEESSTVHRFSRLVEETSPSPPNPTIDLDGIAMLQYTGGTTGRSKGAMLTHRNMTCNAQQLAAWMPRIEPGGEVALGALPYFHIYGLTVGMLLPIQCGATIVLVPNPRDIATIVKSIVKHRVTLFPAVPAIYNAVNHFPGVEKYDLSSVKVCNSGSAPLPGDVLQRFERLTGAKISEGYGLTEASPVTHSNPVFGKRKIGSIGLPLPDTDTRIADLADGWTEVPGGKEGELLIKGPQVMQGYWDQEEETADVLRDGWLRTGDIAAMDEEGYHFIVGRVKDMILASGYNIYPDEVDDTLIAHPAVLESATIGVPDEKRGETVKSFVVRRPGETVTEEELIAYCRENLAAYKVPRVIEFRESLPKSTVLKILRRQLRDEELTKAARE